MVKVDDYTVAFHLEAPNGNFPYLTSSDNYNMIILPNGYDPANWQSSFVGTGPFMLEALHAEGRRHVHPQRVLLGHQGAPAQTQFTFYDTQSPAILALTGGNIDVVGQFSVSGGAGTAQRQLQHHQAEVQRAPRAVHALRHRPRSPTPGSARPSR